jgi:hypothetical protein
MHLKNGTQYAVSFTLTFIRWNVEVGHLPICHALTCCVPKVLWCVAKMFFAYHVWNAWYVYATQQVRIWYVHVCPICIWEWPTCIICVLYAYQMRTICVPNAYCMRLLCWCGNGTQMMHIWYAYGMHAVLMLHVRVPYAYHSRSSSCVAYHSLWYACGTHVAMFRRIHAALRNIAKQN